ncbi:MAG TPA: UDP-N-acetylglucosamine 2-epimerase (non-hydrolyzing) [Polyangiaceae bacterium]|nr:UDP-N-acetylglucosamine 2-epimerase (non-hydrolyzing) [Polyangiaceae bacterium]
MKSIVTVVGARPQFIKASAVSRELLKRGTLRESIVHTGQHYDAGLSDVFFEELTIPPPTHHLEVGSGSHGGQTGEMLKRIETVLLNEKPDLVLVYGDTNSTMAGALAAAKIHVPVAHVEAGLRSFNRRMPEEINRVVTDHVSSLLFCPTLLAVEQLRTEGIVRGVHHVGDVMYDVALSMAARAEAHSRFRNADLPTKGFVLATVHRAENTDDRSNLQSIIEALGRLSARMPVVFPLHPRTKAAMARHGLHTFGSVRIIEPTGLSDMTWLERHAAVIITDSGGIQKEAYFHRTPCVTVRTETEWSETIDAGWNRLANPGDFDAIVAAAESSLLDTAGRREVADYGTGSAAAALVDVLAGFVAS